MAIEHKDLSGGLRHIVLSGRLDFHGVEKIIGQLSSLLTTSGSIALIDLTQATLICSMGIRALILNAKNMQQRGGRMALLVDDGTDRIDHPEIRRNRLAAACIHEPPRCEKSHAAMTGRKHGPLA